MRPIRPHPRASRSNKAAVAVGHTILVIAYHLLARDQEYTELGSDFYVQLHERHKTAYTNRLVRQLQRLGYNVSLQPANAA